MATLQIEILPAASDNYIFVLYDAHSLRAMLIDPTESRPALDFLRAKKLKLEFIFNTHHHHDHIGGNLELKRATGAKIICSEYDFKRIPEADLTLADGDHFTFLRTRFEAIFIPGHTLGHTALYSPQLGVVFTGDTLFSLGCGRLFEGTAEQMLQSLAKLVRLPDSTQVYCGHEYTQKNLEFALKLEPNNKKLLSDREIVGELRKRGLPTLPTNLAREKELNPFLRVASAEFRNAIGMGKLSTFECFKQLREMRNTF